MERHERESLINFEKRHMRFSETLVNHKRQERQSEYEKQVALEKLREKEEKLREYK